MVTSNDDGESWEASLAIQDESTDDARKVLSAKDVLELVPTASLFHDDAGDAFVTVSKQASVRTFAVRSHDFALWLAAVCYTECHRTPSKGVVDQVVSTCEALGVHEGDEREVFFRVGHQNGRTYVDLGDSSGQAIEIDSTGYRIVAVPPVPFRRGKGQLALPVPQDGGSVYDLAPVLNLDGDELDLIVIFLLSLLLPTGPYPVLYVSGEQGSAKSTASRMIRSLVDPNVAALRGNPRDPRDLWVAAERSWVVTMDNLSSMPKGVADGLCRLTSGTGQSVRQNYEDKEEVLFTATRPVLINGIPELVIRQDLADRTLRVDCQAIPDSQRRSEEDVLNDLRKYVLSFWAHCCRPLPVPWRVSRP